MRASARLPLRIAAPRARGFLTALRNEFAAWEARNELAALEIARRRRARDRATARPNPRARAQVSYPHPALRAANAPIPAAEAAGRAPLAKRMLEIMYEAGGVGLAAPQVGVNARLMVFNPTGRAANAEAEVVLLNPVVVAASADVVIADEGCLSFLDGDGDPVAGPVARAAWVDVAGVDAAGADYAARLDGWAARIFQHEYDHLRGVCFVDYLDAEHRARLRPDLECLVRAFDADAAGGTAAALLDRDRLPPLPGPPAGGEPPPF